MEGKDSYRGNNITVPRKSSIDSVIPSASAVSSDAAGGETYLNSFFNTESEKYGFSLKCYRVMNGSTTRDV